MTGSLPPGRRGWETTLPFLISPKPRGAVILSERAERARAKDLVGFPGSPGLRPVSVALSNG